jgi:hypothetical protein
MNRRKLLGYLGSGVCCALGGRASYALQGLSGSSVPVQIRVNEDRVFGSIPRDFIGLGYEISSVARSGLLSATNRVYVELVRTLGTAGVIRVGGNTADYASYSAKGKAVSAPKATIVNRESLRELRSFLDATGWRLIWGLDLGQSTVDEVVEEAQVVSTMMGGKLLAFEIGNEPDLFAHEGHRQGSYTFERYLGEYQRYKSAIRAKVPGAPFAGPDVAGHTDWVPRFAAAERNDLKLLTHHYYRGGQGPDSSYAMLLNPDPKLVSTLQSLQRASVEANGLPYRICETNSFSGGGRPGISGTFGAALWVLEYLFTLAWHDAAGVNLETGVNQLDFISSYSPIGDDERGTYTPEPEYYGMLAFGQASDGKRIAAEASKGPVNISCYAVKQGRKVIVTVINKDRTAHAMVDLRCRSRIGKATAVRLEAPALESSTGMTLAGASVTAGGHWKPGRAETLQASAMGARIDLSPGSAALVTLMV